MSLATRATGVPRRGGRVFGGIRADVTLTALPGCGLSREAGNFPEASAAPAPCTATWGKFPRLGKTPRPQPAAHGWIGRKPKEYTDSTHGTSVALGWCETIRTIQRRDDIMRPTLHIATALSALLIAATSAAAQQPTAADDPATTPPPAAAREKVRPITIQYFRPLDQRGVNVFETTKEPGAEYEGFKLEFGASFTSQVQNLSHRNTAAPSVVNGVNANQLADIGFGF